MTLRRRSGQVLAFALTLFVAVPAFAQFKDVDIRPFALAADERFAAHTTFSAAFESASEPFFGGGVDVVVRRKVFVDLAISHMSRTGERFYVDDALNVFRLGIASHVTLTPVELSAGYRWRHRSIIPYAGIGVGWYHYQQVDDFSTAAENVDTTHAGFLATTGVEFRVAKWFGIAGDARYTRVPGILGQPGLTSGSKALNEDDLGGIAARVRVILGK